MIHFRKKSILATDADFYIGNKRMELVREYRYLEILFNEHLDFQSIYNDNLNKSERDFFNIKQDWCKRGEIRPYVFKKIIRALVFPIFDYGSVIWSPFIGCLKREAFNLKIARFFLGVSPLHPILMRWKMTWDGSLQQKDIKYLEYCHIATAGSNALEW